jgi:hypothetical protein
MGKIAFKIMGGFVLYFAAAMLGITVLEVAHLSPRLAAEATPFNVARSVFFAAAIASVGLGLIYLKKWAAILLSVLLLYPAFWSIRFALEPAPRPGDENWLGYIYGVLLILPAILTVKCWRTLV